jgi:hypothetical protein
MSAAFESNLLASTRPRRHSVRRALAVSCVSALVLGLTSCGGEDAKTTSAAALSLQQAMDSASSAIDGVRGTRASLEGVGASLRTSGDQTGDVIGVLTPLASDSDTTQKLLTAARSQRTFLGYASDSTTSRTRGAALAALSRAREAGRRAAGSYAQLAQSEADLAGKVPSATTFNTGRLRDAVVKVTAPAKKPQKSDGKKSGGTTNNPQPAKPASADCGAGVSVNAVTSCPFGRNVAGAYGESGGASVIDVYSPVTKTNYTMNCSGGSPVVCRGGNGAVVTIR